MSPYLTHFFFYRIIEGVSGLVRIVIDIKLNGLSCGTIRFVFCPTVT